MLRRHIVLLIAIRLSDRDVKPGDPLGAFREQQAMSWHRVSRSPFLSSSSSHTTQLHIQSSLPQLPIVHNTDTHPTHNVVCPSGALFENRPHSMPSIHLAWNPKHVIVQWVGIGTHTYAHISKEVKCCHSIMYMPSTGLNFPYWFYGE